MTICTTFNAGFGFNKFPVSPTSDNKFTFTNLKLPTNLDFFRVMVKNFILNIPLEGLKKATNSYRRKVDLKAYCPDTVKYFVIDIEEVHSKNDQNAVIRFFKQYKVILGESDKFNGIDNFNMTGVLFVNPVMVSEFKFAMCALNDSLKGVCIVDTSASRMATFKPPIGKENIIINNECGELYTFDRSIVKNQVNVIKESYEYSKNFMNDNDTSRRDSTLNREFIKSIKDVDRQFETIEDLSLYVFSTMGFEYMNEDKNNNSLIFKHHSEMKSPGGYFWYREAPYTMNHFNALKTVNIFDSVKKMPQAKDLLDVKLNYAELLSSENDLKTNTTIVKNSKYLEVDSDVKMGVQKFLYDHDCKLLKIKSAMGTGKSTVIDYIIKEAHFDDLSVLIITNRVSVADDFNKKYNMKIYNKDCYHIGDSLICQYDSLWRYDIRYFDIVIMDEFVSVLLHSRNSVNKSAMNTNKFFKSFNKKVVIADAFLTGYEDYFFANKTENSCVTIQNDYRDETELFAYEDANYFIQMIKRAAENEQITVSSTSTTFIKSLEAMLYKNGIKVITLMSDTSQFSKDIIYSTFNQSENLLFDVLIFSPTLTVGVSNLNNIKKHFHYDSSRSTDVISSLQMIKRTRKTSEIHYHIKPCKCYAPLSYSILRDEYIHKIGKNIEQNHLFEYDNYGNPNISKLGKMSILIDVFKNVIEYSHLSAFEYLLSYHFKESPTIITDKFIGNILSRYSKMLKKDNKEADSMALQQYINLNQLGQLDLDLENISTPLKNIIKIHESLLTVDADILKSIIDLQLNDQNFISKCYYWKLLKNLDSEKIDIKFINKLVSSAIKNHESSKYNHLNSIIEYDGYIRSSYTIREVKNNPKLKSFLKVCGFVETRSESMIRSFSIDENVDMYCEYVNIGRI